MPVHDWTCVDAGIFHHFHHQWISAISGRLNAGLLPADYYALAEQQVGGFGPDVLTLQRPQSGAEQGGAAGLLLEPPRVRFQAEAKREFHPRKKSTIVVRHVTGDRIVAVVEIMSPGNKGSKHAFRAFIDKACEFLACRVHLLILDLFPPTKRDPHGLHSALWEIVDDETFTPPPDKPLTLVAYESGLTTKAHIEPVAVGDALPEMPLFVEPSAYVLVPLEATYQEAFQSMPLRWREVLETPRA